MKLGLRLALFVAMTLMTVHGAKILFVTSNLSNSMVIFAGRMVDVLVKGGHNVTMLIYDLRPANQMNGTKLGKVVRVSNLGTDYDDLLKLCDDIFDCDTSLWGRRAEWIAELKICERVIDRRHEIDHLASEGFDLAIGTGTAYCDLGLAKMLGIPLIAWTTTGPVLEVHSYSFGLPPTAAYYPVAVENRIPFEMNVFQRVQNVILYYAEYLFLWEHELRANKFFRSKVDPQFPAMSDLVKQSVLFVNGDPFADPARPFPPNFVHVGGIGLQPQCDLPEVFRNIVDHAQNGFVVISFGSAAPTKFFSEAKKRAIVGALAQFRDIEFVFKADADDFLLRNLTAGLEHVHVFSWIPQEALLSHRKARALVTHGGYNSVIEGAVRGVPMLVLPLFFDQHRNGHAVQFKGMGRLLWPREITTRSFAENLHELLHNPSYMRTSKRVQFLHRHKPHPPERNLLDWVHFLVEARNTSELISRSADQSPLVLLHLDLLLLAVGAVWLGAALKTALFCRVSVMFRGRRKVKSD